MVLSRTRWTAAADQLPSLGFPPPSRQQYRESTYRRASRVSPTFRPQRFTRSRRLTPPRTWRACFIPHAACEVRPTGGFPDTQPTRLIAGPFSLDLLTSNSSWSGEPDYSSVRSTASRALIQVPIRLHRQSFYVCLRLDPLLSCQTPRVFTVHLVDAFAPPPLMVLPTDSSSDAGKRPTAFQSVPG